MVVRVRSSSWRFAALLALSVAVLATAGCQDAPTSPSSAPFSQSDLRVGTGAEAATGRTLTVHYTGWFYNRAQPDQKGAQFDSSAGSTPFTFVLGVGGVISGWDQGLIGMKAGGLRRLIIPPSLGYGSSRNGPIPPNATLLFEVELIDVQ